METYTRKKRGYTTEELVYIAELYYIHKMSQQQIAEITHQSRTNVSRLLGICEETGIVEHRITVLSQNRFSLSSALEERFGLIKAIIVPSSDNIESNKIRVSIEAGEYINSILHDDMTIGVAWGSMIYHIIQNFSCSKRYKIDVVQSFKTISFYIPARTYSAIICLQRLCKPYGKVCILAATCMENTGETDA